MTAPDPAAAVPEAQDGRETEPPFWCGRAETHEPHAYYRLDAKMACYGYPTESAPSAAVREGERERLAAAWDYGWRAGWDDRESGDGQVTPNAYWPNDAAPSLAAPKGTGEKP